MKETKSVGKRLLTTKEFMEYTGFGEVTAERFWDSFKLRRKIVDQWRYDKVKTDKALDKLFGGKSMIEFIIGCFVGSLVAVGVLSVVMINRRWPR